MAKMQIKRVGVLSTAKIFAVVMAGIMLIIMIPVALIMMLAGSAASSESGAAAAGMFGFGLIGVILAPIFYGVIGFIFGALYALIYNIAAGFVGGLEMDVENVGFEYGAPPPPSQPWTQQPQPPYQSSGNQPY